VSSRTPRNMSWISTCHRRGAEPKPLIDHLDEAEGCIKGLLLDTANLTVAAMLFG
jgi:hypothetical protein